jgi:hypothetical protein
MNFTHQDELRLWWQHLPAAVRSRIWPGLLATLAVLGLVLAFHQVVRGAVEQGDLRRAASAARAEAAWRCAVLRGPLPRDSCLAQADAAQHIEPSLQARNASTAATVAWTNR